jgi:hypothetical protein
MENQPQVAVPENDSDVTVVDTYDADAVKKALETTAAQKKHWREKAKKESDEKATLQARLKEYEDKANSQKLETPEKPQSHADFDSLADNLAVLRNLSDDEVNELRRLKVKAGKLILTSLDERLNQRRLLQHHPTVSLFSTVNP